MKIFGNRKFAILIALVVIIFATLLGVRGSLNRLARNVESMFYDGVYLDKEGYTQRGIASHLSNRANSALGFATLMEKHPDLSNEAGELRLAQRKLQDAGKIRDKYSANEAMQNAFDKLAEKTRSVTLSQNEKDDIENYKSSFIGAKIAIEESQYNEKARSFMDNATFLAHLLKPILFIRSPQVFA